MTHKNRMGQDRIHVVLEWNVTVQGSVPSRFRRTSICITFRFYRRVPFRNVSASLPPNFNFCLIPPTSFSAFLALLPPSPKMCPVLPRHISLIQCYVVPLMVLRNSSDRNWPHCRHFQTFPDFPSFLHVCFVFMKRLSFFKAVANAWYAIVGHHGLRVAVQRANSRGDTTWRRG